MEAAAPRAWSLRCKLKNSKKKARDGGLSFVGRGAGAQLVFDWDTQAARPQFKLPLASITDQMVSKGEDKAMMKVVTADASQICVLQFYSRQDQQATLTKLLELRGALVAAPAVPLVVLSGIERGNYLAKDKELRAQYQDLVADGALRDEDFWKDDELQRRLALERAESGAAGLPAPVPKQVHGRTPTGIHSGSEQPVDKQAVLVDKEMSEHIFLTERSVYADFKASVLTGRVPEAEFWAAYLQTKQSDAGRPAAKQPDAHDQSAAKHATGDSGAHLLEILRGAAMQEKALHERRVATGELQSATSRQAANESRPAAIGLQPSVSDRHEASVAEVAGGSEATVFGDSAATAAASAGQVAVGSTCYTQWAREAARPRSAFSSALTTGAGREGGKRSLLACNNYDRTLGQYDQIGVDGAGDVDGDDEDDADDAWCAEVSNWEPCSAAAFRSKRRRLITQSKAAPSSGECGGVNGEELLSFTLGGGAPYGITNANVGETAMMLASATNGNPVAERYTSELKTCFGRSLQYLRHFWLAVSRGDRPKARRMHTALKQLYDTIEKQNGLLGATQRASLAPMSRHLQQQMLRTALTSLPDG